MNYYIKEFIADRKSYCSKESLRYYTETLGRFDYWLQSNQIDILNLTTEDLKRYVLDLRGSGVKNVSVNTYYRSVKVLCRWLHDEEYIKSDITKKVRLPRNDNNIIIPLTSEEVSRCDNIFLSSGRLGLRNYCIFHLMLDCGLRRQEVINLNFNDVKPNMITIRLSKCNKSRVVILPDFLYSSICNYIASDQRVDDVFLDRYYENQITVDTIKKLFSNLKKQSGIPRIHAHLLRHTFATSYLYYGGNMEMLRLLMGHASYDIMQNYLHLAVQEQLVGTGLYKLDDVFFRK